MHCKTITFPDCKSAAALHVTARASAATILGRLAIRAPSSSSTAAPRNSPLHPPALAVFAGGGAITIREMQMNVAQGRPMLLLAGSGRATDAVLAARAGQPAGDSRIQEIAHQGAITAWSIEHDPASLRALIETMLAGAP